MRPGPFGLNLISIIPNEPGFCLVATQICDPGAAS